MSFQVIPKQDTIPTFDPKAIAVQHIEFYPFGEIYEQEEITESVISQILREIPEGISILFFLDPDGETDWLEVVCDGEWLFIGYCFDDGGDIYYSYNPDFADSLDLIANADFSNEETFSPIKSQGQSPIGKVFAMTDIQTGVKAVEYFIRTGARYPGIDWVQHL